MTCGLDAVVIIYFNGGTEGLEQEIEGTAAFLRGGTGEAEGGRQDS